MKKGSTETSTVSYWFGEDGIFYVLGNGQQGRVGEPCFPDVRQFPFEEVVFRALDDDEIK